MHDELLLTGRIGVLGAGCKAMPKIKSNGFWVVVVLLILSNWRHFEHSFC